jgi:hypothetical protein
VVQCRVGLTCSCSRNPAPSRTPPYLRAHNPSYEINEMREPSERAKGHRHWNRGHRVSAYRGRGRLAHRHAATVATKHSLRRHQQPREQRAQQHDRQEHNERGRRRGRGGGCAVHPHPHHRLSTRHREGAREIQRCESCESDEEGIWVGEQLTRPFLTTPVQCLLQDCSP